MGIGGKNTRALFGLVKTEYQKRKNVESRVESKLRSFGCNGGDGDCSNLFRSKNYTCLNNYFHYLSECLGIAQLPVFDVRNYGKLHGCRHEVYDQNLELIKKETLKNNIFSFAFVNKKVISFTYINEE